MLVRSERGADWVSPAVGGGEWWSGWCSLHTIRRYLFVAISIYVCVCGRGFGGEKPYEVEMGRNGKASAVNLSAAD